MKPDDETLARIQEAIKRGDKEVDLGAELGVPLKIVRTADGRVEVRGVEGQSPPTVQSQAWDPTPTRPADYPADLPFVPDVRAAVVSGADGTMKQVQWFNPPEPSAQLDLFVEESLAQGWELRSPPLAIAERPGQHRWLVQGNRIRFFYLVDSSSGRSLLALMQMERESPAV